MKKIRRISLTVMAIILAIPMFSLPAKAKPVDYAWSARITAFQELDVNDRNNYPGYTKALQLFLSLFNSTYSEKIQSSGGFDGWYGTTTADCVELFMMTQGVGGKRVADAQTWSSVAHNMDQSGGPEWYYFKVNDKYCMHGHPGDNGYEFRYYVSYEWGTGLSDVFHTSKM